MCGICGFLPFNRPVTGDDAYVVKKMNDRLIHRGPDSQQVLSLEEIVLGFSRLSIIGVDNGMQPIFNEDESLVLICNGEIFNYIELRAALKNKGHRFRTESDVEVILHMYEDQGMDLLSKLNGQFAFVLYDKKIKKLFCARDHMGIIPFFYTIANHAFIFGSEIKSILAHPEVKTEVDLVGLDQVFTFAGLISPRTMFRNILSLENGHYLVVDQKGKVMNVEYWDLTYPQHGSSERMSDAYYIRRVGELFENSVKLRLRTDVPYGVYLSGGLDSSMIAMKIRQLSPGASLEAFSIDFVDSHHSEAYFQKLVAEQANITLNSKVFFYGDISARLSKSVYHSECPVKETYNTASLSLSEAVRNKGFKVILSGEGADELFGGYVGYRFDKMRSLGMISNPCSQQERELRNRLWGDETFLYEVNFLDFNLVKQGLYSHELNASFDEINCLNYQVVNTGKLQHMSLMEKRAYIDYKIRLVDHLVSDHGDRMALANSVEVRYPFLDKDFVDFSTTIPGDLKLNEFNEKYILKEVARSFVPRPIIEREKFGFVAPGSPYLVQQNIEYINDILSSDVIRRQGYFNPNQVQKLKATYQKSGFTINAPFESDLLITIITFGMLLDHFKN